MAYATTAACASSSPETQGGALLPSSAHPSKTERASPSADVLDIEPVVLGRRCLRRACPHGKTSDKGKARQGEENYFKRCDCAGARLDPAPSREEQYYMVKTMDRHPGTKGLTTERDSVYEDEPTPADEVAREKAIAHDLRWWIGTMAPFEGADRSISYIRDERFTRQHLQTGILHAIAIFTTLISDVAYLTEYAKRYDLTFPNLLHDSNLSWLELKQKDFLGKSRKDLLVSLWHVCDEVDVGAGRMYDVHRRILRAKMQEAKWGDEGERKSLVAMGFAAEVEEMQNND
ncbi:hypothetical protein LTR62_006277 [Meristemomyces frigidus]|uniref:Uncharacterized protein n=1 Tax=Meristemomyces frigidus TaxID=1508187 RepID=A0AAN7TCB6_9PEZI|nr:hypothetical protein LTR62_006277 [Meristemomyces frigidus]